MIGNEELLEAALSKVLESYNCIGRDLSLMSIKLPSDTSLAVAEARMAIKNYYESIESDLKDMEKSLTSQNESDTLN